MPVELKVPSLGESVTEAEIGEWLKKEGDAIKTDEDIVVLDTAKVSQTLPSPLTGTLTKIVKQLGEVVNVGDVIAILEEQAAQPTPRIPDRTMGKQLEPLGMPSGTARYWNEQPKVFVIYGHDAAVLEKVELLLRRLGCEPLIFSQFPKSGSETNIELLERVMPQADVLVALFTPDDEGREKGSDQLLRPRARQNVLVEAGYALIQKRRTSLIIAVGGVEIPSDFDGINRIQGDLWDATLERRLAHALHDLDLPVNLRWI